MRNLTSLYCLIILIASSAFLPGDGARENARLAAVMPVMADDCSKQTGLAKVVCLAQAFKATLQDDQAALLQLEYSKKDAVKWSNFPQGGARPGRVGLSLGALTPVQLTAMKALMASVLAREPRNEGADEVEGILAADDYFGRTTGKTSMFGSTHFYIAFLGQPSTSGLWELQFGGHHLAFANTYKGGNITGATPSFRGVEPMAAIAAPGRTYQPIEQEREAFATLIEQLGETGKNAARLSGTFSDILLGPGQDNHFPDNKQGVKIAGLSPAQKKLVTAAIGLYVDDLDPVTAKKILSKYTAELPDTYLSFTGSGTMSQVNDYIRIDGPSVWIEYSVQPSRDFPNTTHPHSVWRDRTGDYGGN